MPESFNLDRLPTPIGTALLVSDSDGLLRALDWEDYEPPMKQLLRLHYGAVDLKNAQAPSELRAEKPDDVLFAGAKEVAVVDTETADVLDVLHQCRVLTDAGVGTEHVA